MLSGSTALITTIFKCPSMKPCGAALIDAGPASVRKMQAAVTELGMDDIRTKTSGIVSTIGADFSMTTPRRRGPLTAALFPESTSSGYGPLPPRGNFHMPCEWVAA